MNYFTLRKMEKIINCKRFDDIFTDIDGKTINGISNLESRNPLSIQYVINAKSFRMCKVTCDICENFQDYFELQQQKKKQGTVDVW